MIHEDFTIEGEEGGGYRITAKTPGSNANRFVIHFYPSSGGLLVQGRLAPTIHDRLTKIRGAAARP